MQANWQHMPLIALTHEPRNRRSCSEFLVPQTATYQCRITATDQNIKAAGQPSQSDAPTYGVDGDAWVRDGADAVRTIARHGVTGAELRRLGNAVWFMRQHYGRDRRATLWWLTADRGTSRNDIANIWKRVGRLQAGHDLPAYSALTFETRGGLHAHIVFVGNDQIASRLKTAAFGARVTVEPVPDPNGLARRYLAKERTPQAGFRRRDLGGRLRGSHLLPGGGDRVRLSRELERDAIEGGYIEPWRHTNAKRQEAGERKPYPKRPLTKRALRLAEQLALFPEIERPVARLHMFGGGHVPPSVALEIEHRRQRLGLTQRELAGMVGIGQAQYANARRGHDPISAWVANRLRDRLFW